MESEQTAAAEPIEEEEEPETPGEYAREFLLDVVLGYGAHADPAAEMVTALREANAIARRDGRTIAWIGFVCGTEQDPQGLSRQEAALTEAGVILAASNAQAVRIAQRIIDA